MDMRELHSNAKCPCESGKRYGQCCKKKKLQWVIDEHGDIYKRIPISPEMRKIVKELEADYQRYFERSPQGSDPIVLGKYLFSPEEIGRQTAEAMKRAGMRPELIYAYQKTGGLLLSRENEALMPEKDVQDWKAALDKYHNSPPTPSLLESLIADFEDESDTCLVCLGYVLENGLDESANPLPSSSEFFTVDAYVLLCATKSMKTLRSIKVLVQEEIGADGLALARHLLENYLHIACCMAKPEMVERLVDVQIGLEEGTHEFERQANGKINSRRVIRKKDGITYPRHVTHMSMAESSDNPDDVELFDYWYDILSGYTHPTFDGFELVIGESGTLNALSNELSEEAMFFSICFAAMILDQLLRLPSVSKQGCLDIAVVVRRIGRKATALIDELFKDRGVSAPFSVLRRRLQALGGSA